MIVSRRLDDVLGKGPSMRPCLGPAAGGALAPLFHLPQQLASLGLGLDPHGSRVVGRGLGAADDVGGEPVRRSARRYVSVAAATTAG